jgi:uncharacterized membrane protein YagU involved in acid resistance
MARVLTTFSGGRIVAAGVLAGVVFALFEMVASALLMGPAAFFMPLRMIGAIVLGPQALDPTYSLAAAAVAGVLVHMVLSIAFAFAFAAVASPLSTTSALVAGGIGFGVALWLINFYLIAPLAGWTWFPERANPVVQFLAHAFFFGAPVGWYLSRARTLIVRPA